MLLPKKLKKGDTIGIVAPSKPFKQDLKFEVDNFIEYMKAKEINVKLSKNIFASDKYGSGAGTPQQRADDINNMFRDNQINAVWCLQGGNPANQVLDLIDYDLIKGNPKLFLGKSDIDVLTLAVNKITNLVTFHCCDTKIGSNKELDFDYSKKWFEERLFNGSKIIEPSEKWFCVNEGKAEGKLLGCNPISILKLAGTKYFPDFRDGILFLEFYKSSPEEVIWQITQFKQLGVFDKIKGVVIGNNFEFQSEKFKVEEIIKDLLEEYNLPILKINEFGHYQPHAFLPIGARVKLDATNKKLEIISEILED